MPRVVRPVLLGLEVVMLMPNSAEMPEHFMLEMSNMQKSRADCIAKTLTCLGLSSPRSISSTYRESAFGCCFTLTIWPTLISSMSTVGSSPAFLAAAGASLPFCFLLAPSCCHEQVRAAAVCCCSVTDVACAALLVIIVCRWSGMQHVRSTD